MAGEKEIKKSNFDQRKKKGLSNPKRNDIKRLPWWVELFFVQIGLPDKWLVDILKSKKRANEFYKEEKKIILSILLFLITLWYFQPVIKYSNKKLNCQRSALDYLKKSYELSGAKKIDLKMFAVNFCNGGNEINKLRLK